MAYITPYRRRHAETEHGVLQCVHNGRNDQLLRVHLKRGQFCGFRRPARNYAPFLRLAIYTRDQWFACRRTMVFNRTNSKDIIIMFAIIYETLSLYILCAVVFERALHHIRCIVHNISLLYIYVLQWQKTDAKYFRSHHRFDFYFEQMFHF